MYCSRNRVQLSPVVLNVMTSTCQLTSGAVQRHQKPGALCAVATAAAWQPCSCLTWLLAARSLVAVELGMASCMVRVFFRCCISWQLGGISSGHIDGSWSHCIVTIAGCQASAGAWDFVYRGGVLRQLSSHAHVFLGFQQQAVYLGRHQAPGHGDEVLRCCISWQVGRGAPGLGSWLTSGCNAVEPAPPQAAKKTYCTPPASWGLCSHQLVVLCAVATCCSGLTAMRDRHPLLLAARPLAAVKLDGIVHGGEPCLWRTSWHKGAHRCGSTSGSWLQ